MSTRLNKALSLAIVVILVATAITVAGLVKAQGGASEQFEGYNKATGKWVNANLGDAYVEGDFVSYELMIQSSSKAWGNDFSISFDFFQASSDAIYVDGFDTSATTGFQYTSTGSFLPDGRDLPTGSPVLTGWPGTHIPTPEAGEAWSSGARIINYMDPFPAGSTDGTPAGSAPDTNHYFTVSGLPWNTFTSGYVILFFRAHLALTAIWSNALESALPTQLDGDQFQSWTNAWQGSSAASGSSRHFALQYPGIGDKTIPIPIAQYPITLISGHKYVGGVLYDGWQVTLNGFFVLGSGLPSIPYNPPAVLTGMGTFQSGAAWPPGYFEFTGLVTGSFTLTEEDRAGYGHVDIVVGGAATNVVKNVAAGTVSFDLAGGASATVDFYNSGATTTTTLLSASSITLGQSVTDTATVTGSGAAPTGTVQFWVKFDSGSWTLFSTKTLDGNGQAVSDSYKPLEVGSYWFKASYGGDPNNLASESGDTDEPLTVGPATPTVTTLLSSSSIVLGNSITDTVTVTGLASPFPMPTGTVDFYVKIGAGSWTLFSTKALVSGQATSDSYTPLAAGSYHFKAVYSGDLNYVGAQSGETEEPLTVGPATPTVTTQLSESTITLGASITDTVTVTGLGSPFPGPTGTVEFQVQIGNGAWNQFGSVKTLVNGQATSDSYKPLAAGSYHFRAIYSGDSNYNGAQSGDTDEPLAVEPATPTVTTLLSATSITLGGSVTDTATVAGLPSPFPMPTGTVQFYVRYGIGSWTLFSTKTLDANGQATSDSYTPLLAGSYHFKAVYLGDSNYIGAQSGETDEPLTVGPATPAVTTLLSDSSIVLGDSVTDMVTVTGLPSPFPVPTGTVQFQVSSDGGATWTTFSTKTLDASGHATSDAYTPLAAGNYLFRALYSGDANYKAAQSGNNDEPLFVDKYTPTVTTLLSATTIQLGGSVTDTATVTGLASPPFPMPTGTVQFYVKIGAGSWTLFSTKTLDANGQAVSDSYTPNTVDAYHFKAVYLGDSNYYGAQSGENDEPLNVQKPTPTVTTQLSATVMTLGDSVTDMVTVTGLPSPFPVPTGTVEFYVKIGAGSWTLFSTKTLVNGQAVSAAYTPLSAGSYHFKAVYLGDSNYNGAQSGENDEPLEVERYTPSVATLLSKTLITLGGSVTDMVTVTGLPSPFPMPTGAVQFEVSSDGGASWTLFSTKALDALGQATSDPYTPLSAGDYLFRALYAGDSNYEPAQSGDNDEPLSVGPATPTVQTLLSDSIITLGDSVTDAVTVTGLPAPFPMPTGTVEFYVKLGAGSWTLFSTKTLDANGQATSDSYTPLLAGSYHFKAVYLGDSNYVSAQSGENDEPLVVEKYTPTVRTLLSESTITLGDSVTDTVTVVGLPSPFPMPTGTVEFYVKVGAGSWTLFSTKTLDANGQATSDAYTPLMAGSYHFKAVYLGDANYNGAQSGENDEPLTVGPATPTVTTQLSETVIVLGDSVTDTVTVTGLPSPFPMPTGTVQFQVSSDGGATWTTFSTKPLDANGQATSDMYTPLAGGDYLFRALYSGDVNYNAAQSGDNDEPLTVAPATPTVTTQLSATTIVLGDSVTDTVTVVGLPAPFPVPTGTVQFQVSTDGGATWTTFSTKTLDASGQATSDPYTPASGGNYLFRAIYSGDANYKPAASGDNDEPLSVTSFTTRTVGYWKNHPSAWVGIKPTDLFPWTTGRAAGKTYMQILSLAPKGDASIILAYQYIAAVLNNNAYGAPPTVLSEIAHAEYLFSHGYPVGSNPPTTDPVRSEMITLASELEAYNVSGDF